MVLHLYSLNTKNFKVSKKSQYIIRGANYCIENVEEEFLPWEEREIYQKDYKKIRNLFYQCIEFMKTQSEYKQYIEGKDKDRMLISVLGPYIRLLLIQIIQTRREICNWKEDEFIIIYKTYIEDKSKLKPLDLDDYNRNYISNLEWIEHIKSDIVQFSRNGNVKIIDNISGKKYFTESSVFLNLKKLIFGFFLELYLYFKKKFFNDQILISSTFGFSKSKKLFKDSKRNNWFLHRFSLGNYLQRYKLNKIRINNFNNYSYKNSKIRLMDENNRELELFKYLWKKYSPVSISSGFEETIKRSLSIYPNKRLKAIITSCSYFNDEYFNTFTSLFFNKLYFKYIILQHGGGFGFSEYNDEEELQMITADEFWSWGWTKTNVKIPMKLKVANIKNSGSILLNKQCNLNRTNKPINVKSKKYIYFALNEWLRADKRLFGSPTSHGQRKMHKELIYILNNLDSKLSKNLILRLHKRGRYDLYKTLTNEKIDFKFSDRDLTNIIDDITKSEIRLFITTDNSTTWLEALVINIPSVLLLGPNYKDVSNSLSELFDKAKDLNMIFEVGDNLHEWINKNYDNISSWWSLREVQSVRRDLVRYFAKEPNSKFQGSIYNFIKEN